MNPSLEASWRHPWRQDLHTGADGGAGEVFRGHQWGVLGAPIRREIGKNAKYHYAIEQYPSPLAGNPCPGLANTNIDRSTGYTPG
ncbi:hypothetical protein [Halorhodospira halochloris]|uniref:hypothetical protein n=1 Tax=Halorhodospira halochloris TaxID=1052 RepID=UPI0013A5923E|nr:hypothetical protein [Halorhodospira halochloris]